MKHRSNPAILFILLPLLALLSGCMGDDDVKHPYAGYTPVDNGDDWVLSTPEAESMLPSYVESAYQLMADDERFIMARSLLVFRNGRLVAEAYPRDPEDMNRIENIQSATKSFTSICAGIALQQGLFSSVREPLKDILPDEFTHFPTMADIRLEDALTMRTGIDFDNGSNTVDLYLDEGNSVEYVLGLEKLYPAGTVFHYHDGAPQLVSAAIEQRSGMTLENFAAENLFAPLGITEWKWERAKDGRTFGAFSLFLKPRDCGKFGQLLLDGGRWKGARVVDNSWIAKATSSLVTSEASGAQYGYYFWVYPASDAFAAEGHGGQFIYVVPAKQLVIVYTAWPYTDGDLWDNFFEIADLLQAACQ